MDYIIQLFCQEAPEPLTGIVFSRSDVVVAQPVVLQERLHGVGRPAYVAGVHGLRVVQLVLAGAGLVAVGRVSALARSSSSPSALQQHVLQVGLLGRRHRRPLHAPAAAAAVPPGPSLGRLAQTVGRPVVAAAAAGAAAVAGDVAAVEDAVLLLQVPLQQGYGVEGLAAEAARELLAVRGDVALQLHLGPEGLAAEDALPRLVPW